MGYQKNYFDRCEGEPLPLVASRTRRIRFEDVDCLGMVWHGNYPSFFEDGRIAIGDRYGFNYHLFRDNRTVAPVVQMHVDYRVSLRFDETISIEAMLHWTESARVNISYTIRNASNEIAATGYTVQLLTEPDGTTMLLPPQWLLDFRRRWRAGEFLEPGDFAS